MSYVEYKVRPVTRFIVTRYEKTDESAGSIQVGEFVSEGGATLVAKALVALDRNSGVSATLDGQPDSFKELLDNHGRGDPAG